MIKKVIIWRVYMAFGAVCLLGIAVICQSFRIQMVEGEHWRSLADSLTTKYVSVEAERGNILSEDGRLLATSLPFFEIRMDVAAPTITREFFYDNVDSLALCFSQKFKDKSSEEYKRLLIKARKRGERYFLLKRKVSYPDYQEMTKWPIFRLGKFKGGLIASPDSKREMPFKMLAYRTIGYYRPGLKPVGLEGAFDKYLAGVKGKRLMQKISGGTLVPINYENEINPKNGQDIITTIDVNLQDVAQSALLRSLQQHNADHGCVIVMEVKTGKIKAIANLGKTENGNYWETYNYAIGESTEPGSTFKLASMIALLEDNLVEIDDSVNIDKGVKKFFDRVMRDSEDHDYTKVSVKKAFEISSNVGVSKLVSQYYGKNPQIFIDHLHRMGLHKSTGIEIAGEPNPVMKNTNDKRWSGITLPWMSVGYEVQLTPLQTLSLYNAVANNGVMMKPYLVTALLDNGDTTKVFEPVAALERICSEQTLEKVKILLEGVVEEGTAKNIKSSNFSFAGKTGTSKIADKKHGYKEIYQASFAGYFPADNPKYSCIVVISAPSNGIYYGSLVAGPVFKDIADKVYSSAFDMHASVNTNKINKQVPAAKAGNIDETIMVYNKLGISYSSPKDCEWVTCEPKDNSVNLRERTSHAGRVPNVSGMGLKDAIYLLEKEGLTVRATGKGKVIKQSLLPGTNAVKGYIVYIELG